MTKIERAPRTDQVYRADTYYQDGAGWWLTVEGFYARRETFGPFQTLHGALNAALFYLRDRTTPTRYYDGGDDGK